MGVSFGVRTGQSTHALRPVVAATVPAAHWAHSVAWAVEYCASAHQHTDTRHKTLRRAQAHRQQAEQKSRNATRRKATKTLQERNTHLMMRSVRALLLGAFSQELYFSLSLSFSFFFFQPTPCRRRSSCTRSPQLQSTSQRRTSTGRSRLPCSSSPGKPSERVCESERAKRKKERTRSQKFAKVCARVRNAAKGHCC